MRRPLVLASTLLLLPTLARCVGSDPALGTNDPVDGATETTETGPTDDASAGGDVAPSEEAAVAHCPEVPCVNQACIDGVCHGVCAPGQVKCSGNGVQTCEASGQWGTPVECVSSTCANGKCTGS